MQASRNEVDVANSAPFLSPTSSTDVLGSLEDYVDVTSWINGLLDGTKEDISPQTPHRPTDLSELDKRISKLSATLEVVCEDTSAQLERTMDEISRTVPRLTYDIQFMRETGVSLQSALLAVESRSRTSVTSVDTTRALDRLYFLDTVKRNMEASLAVLREAESWSSLEPEVVAFLTEHAYSKAASRLSEASKSLTVFQNTPEFESRRTLMVNLQNQLEASLSSALVAAINNGDVEACKSFFVIFCNIERESEFRGYWNGSKRKGLVDLWQGAIVTDCEEEAITEESTNSRRKFSLLLSDFYQELLTLLQLERVSVMSIFPDPQPTLSTLITSTLSSLHPSLSQRLSSFTSHHGSLILPEIISAFKATEEFAVTANKIMEKAGYAATYSSAISTLSDERETGSQLQKSHSRRRSMRMSSSRRSTHRNSFASAPNAPGNTLPLDNSWDDAIFEPFIEYQVDYASLEKKLLHESLQTLMLTKAPSPDGARLLRERSIDIFTMAEDGLRRCMAFTHGYGAIGLIEALDNMFELFLGSSKGELITSRAVSSRKTDVGSGSLGSGREDFADLDYSADDYTSFQLALHLMEAARGVLDRLTAFEVNLRANLLQTSAALRMMRNDPLGLYFPGTTKGAIELLQGSALNSAELQSLLDSIDHDMQQSHAQSVLTPSSTTLGSQRPSPYHVSRPLLLGARNAVSNFAKACQAFLQETILSPLVKHLSTYASSPTWANVDILKPKRTGGAGGGVSEVVMPTFSLSPSQTIQRVAEGLLNLPRLFEVYADDDALAFSLETLPFVDMDDLRVTATEIDEDKKRQDNAKEEHVHLRRLSSPAASLKVLPNVPSKTLLLTPENVSSAWLASLTLSLLSYLTGNILPSIRTLSDGGAAQLVEDLGYIVQIVKALNVEWEELEQWKEAVELSEEEGRKRLSERKEKGNDTGSDVLKIVARLRGWML